MSAFSLDEALKNVHDETAINQLVGSLEKSLKQQTCHTQSSYDLNKSDFMTMSLSEQSYVSSLSTTSNSNSATLTKNTETNNNYVNSTVIDNSHRSNKQFPNNNQNSSNNNIEDNCHQQIFTNFVAKHPHSLPAQSSVLRNPSIMPKNEPVKLVYPNNNNNNSNTQPTIVTMNNNNRVTLSTAPVNGTITLSPMTANQQGQQMQGANIKIAQTPGSQANNITPTLIFKNANSTQGGTYVTNSPVTLSKTNNNQASTSVVLPNNLFIRPSGQAGQKQAVGQQRVVINQAVRPQNNTFTLPQNSVRGNTILLKQDNGSYQLLTISPAQPGQQMTQNITTSGSTIRLQTVPASIAPNNQTVYVTTSTASGSNHTQQILTTQSTPVVSMAQMPALATASNQQTTGTVVVQQNATSQSPAQRNDNTKEKCRKFLTNLIDLSKREPPQVENNVKTLIQELVDAKVGPEDFCQKLENLLNAAPQPCLVGFLKRSLPLLRQSLVTKETVIEGINPPNPSVAFTGATITTAQIPAQIRPIGQTVTTGSIGQTQIRMVQPGTPRIGQTTIRPTTPQIIRTPMRPMTTIRGQTTIVQTNNQVPALHPVGTTILTSGGQIRSQNANLRPIQIRPQQTTQTVRVQKVQANAIKAQPMSGTTQIKQIQVQVTNNTSVNLNNNSINTKSNNNNSSSNSSIKSHFSLLPAAVTTVNNSTHVVNSKASTSPINNKAPPHLLTKSISISVSSNSSTNSNATSTTNIINKSPTTLNNKSTHHDKKSQGSASKSKDKKTLASVVAATAASNANNSSFYPSTFGDDDINDVAAMGGVNLAEESQKILGSTEFVGTQIRSCKDEVLLNLPALQQRIRQQMARHGLEEPSTDVAVLISHACQERLKNIVEKLAVISEHRLDILKIDPRYENISDVRGQIKFLEELDKAEQKRHEEVEREMLLRAAKSRSKTEDPEQAKLKAKAKEMQRAEMEELRHREANNTALQAIGPRKKLKLDSEGTSTAGPGSLGATGTKGGIPPRPRIKRVNMRDMIFYMEQEKDSCRSVALYKAYLK